jgi:hypothetical protein
MHVACGNGATSMASDGASDPQAEVAARPDAGAPVAAEIPPTIHSGADPALGVHQVLSLSTDHTASAAASGRRRQGAHGGPVAQKRHCFVTFGCGTPGAPWT